MLWQRDDDDVETLIRDIELSQQTSHSMAFLFTFMRVRVFFSLVSQRDKKNSKHLILFL